MVRDGRVACRLRAALKPLRPVPTGAALPAEKCEEANDGTSSTKQGGTKRPPLKDSSSGRQSKRARKSAPKSSAVAVNQSMIQSLLRNFDANDRPDDLRPPCVPRKLSSHQDLSDAALAFTEPKGRFPSIHRGTYIECFKQSGHQSLQAFLDKARVLNPRTPSAMVAILSLQQNAQLRKTKFDICSVISLTLKRSVVWKVPLHHLLELISLFEKSKSCCTAS